MENAKDKLITSAWSLVIKDNVINAMMITSMTELLKNVSLQMSS